MLMGSFGVNFRRRTTTSEQLAPRRSSTNSQLPLLSRDTPSLPMPMEPASAARNVPATAPSSVRVQLVPLEAPLSMSAGLPIPLVWSSRLASMTALPSLPPSIVKRGISVPSPSEGTGAAGLGSPPALTLVLTCVTEGAGAACTATVALTTLDCGVTASPIRAAISVTTLAIVAPIRVDSAARRRSRTTLVCAVLICTMNLVTCTTTDLSRGIQTLSAVALISRPSVSSVCIERRS